MCILDMTQIFVVILLEFKEVSSLNSSLGTHLDSSHYIETHLGSSHFYREHLYIVYVI